MTGAGRRPSGTSVGRGATIIGSAVGDGASVKQVSISLADTTQQSVDLIRDQLGEARAAVLGAVDGDERAAVAVLFDGVEEALEDPAFDPEKVHSRWTRLRDRLTPNLERAANLAQVTSLINDLLS